MKSNDKERINEMYRLLSDWDNSGLSLKEFSRRNGINYSVFKYWNKKRNGERLVGGTSRKNPLPSPPSPVAGKFIPVAITRKPESSGLRITYPNGVQVACPEEIDLEQFKRLIQIY